MNKNNEPQTPPMPVTKGAMQKAMAELKKGQHVEVFHEDQLPEREKRFKTLKNREKRALKKRLGK